MSGWGSWFGGARASNKDAPKNAILQLRSQLEMLNKRDNHLQGQIKEQEDAARKYVNSNKNGTSLVVSSRAEFPKTFKGHQIVEEC